MPQATESAAMPWLRRLGVTTPELVVVTDGRILAPHEAGVRATVGGETRHRRRRQGRSRAHLPVLGRAVGRCRRDSSTRYARRRGGVRRGGEYCLSIALDEISYGAVVRASVNGGVGFDTHQAAAVRVHLSEGLHDHEVVSLLDQADVKDRQLRGALAHALQILWTAFCAAEAVLVEVTPFRWDEQRLVAVGVAVEFDPHGRAAARGFRPDVLVEPGIAPHKAPSPREIAVREADAAEPHRPGVAFFELDGDVAYLISGRGAGLVGLDYLYDNGVLPACYLDASPGAGSAKVQALFRSALSVPGIRGALFGAAVLNLVDARELAQEFIEAAEEAGFDAGHVPTVVRLAGPFEAEAREMLKAGLPGALVLDRAASLEDACDLLISAMGRAPQAWEGFAR